MKLYLRVLLLLIINTHTNKTNEMIFIDKALPKNTNQIKDKNHFFFELFKNQNNKDLLKIKNELENEKNSTFDFLIFETQDLIKESKTKNDFFWQLVHIKTLLKIKNFSTLNEINRHNKIAKIENKIKNKDENTEYKKMLKHFAIKDEINENIGYSKYIHKKLGEQYKTIYEELLVEETPTKKSPSKFIKTSSILIMVAASAILIYFFILIETITINGNKEIIQNIKIISSDGGEIIKGVAEPENEEIINQENKQNLKDNWIDKSTNIEENNNNELENEENIITPESSCFE